MDVQVHFSSIHEKVDEDDHVNPLSEWMKHLPPPAQKVPLHYLAIPGSHDSISSSITPHSDIAPDDSWLYNSWLIRATGCLSRRIIYNWCKTQTFTCLEQLQSGIRYFDMRVAQNTNSDTISFVHGMYGEDVKVTLTTMKTFLDTHRKEVIFLDFQHFYNMTQEEHHKLIYMLTELFGSQLCPYIKDLSDFSLSWLWKRGFQVVVFYRNPVAEYHPFLWPSDTIPNPWPNTTCLKTLLEFLNKGYREGREAGKFYVSQCVLTPTVLTIMTHLFGGLKSLLSIDKYRKIEEWLVDKKPGPKGLNIVICDFVDLDSCSVPNRVVNLNHKAYSTDA